MSLICEHADIQDIPCKGSVFSREITCQAGQSNTCLKRCGPSCPAYKAEAPVKPSPRKPPQSAPQPLQAVQLPRPVQTPVSRIARSGGGCGSCGGSRRIG